MLDPSLLVGSLRARFAMMSRARRFALGFTAAALVAVFLNLLPYLRTRGAMQGDGFEVIGFPFIFRSEGGFAWAYEFSYLALIGDIALALVVAATAGYACSQVRGNDSGKAIGGP